MQWGVHALALQNAGSLLLDGVVTNGFDGTLAVDGLAQRVDNTAQEGFADGDTGALAGTGHQGAHADGFGTIKQHNAQVGRLNTFHHALGTVFKGDNLAVHGAVHAFNGNNAVGSGHNRASLGSVGGGLVVLYAGLQGGQVGLVAGHLVQGMAAGVIKHTVAHLQYIAGKQAFIHADIQ